MTASEVAAHNSFLTPRPDSGIWFEDPPGEVREEKSPSRTREIHGEFMVLVEEVNYQTFPPPEVRAAMKAAGKKVVPMRHHRIYIHLLHSRFMTVRTLKVYKHQGKWLFADSADAEFANAFKTKAPRDRSSLVAVIAGLLRVGINEASHQLISWSGQ